MSQLFAMSRMQIIGWRMRAGGFSNNSKPRGRPTRLHRVMQESSLDPSAAEPAGGGGELDL
jgi:hypothetical protein